jgi:hypothetical protein
MINYKSTLKSRKMRRRHKVKLERVLILTSYFNCDLSAPGIKSRNSFENEIFNVMRSMGASFPKQL